MASFSSAPPSDHLACHLAKLSTELILQIIDFVSPASHLDFACTCKQIATCCSGALQRHKDAYEKYNTASDLDPATVPTLLRSALSLDDPIPAWHVRSFELWHDRRSWNEWKTLKFEVPLHEDTESEPLSWKFRVGEIGEYLECLDGRLGEDELEAAHDQIESGCDGILKMLLFENCPRLRDLKTVDRLRDEFSFLEWFKKLTSRRIGEEDLPLKLTGLQNAAIAIPSGTWMDTYIDVPSTHVFVCLLRLPNIETIYFKDLRHTLSWGGGDVDYTFYLPAGCSSAKHIFLDNCDGDHFPYTLKDSLPKAFRGLITMAFRSGDAHLEHADDLVRCFAHNQSSTLQSLMFYDYGCDNRDTIHGYRCSAFRPEELERFRGLRQVSIDVQDMELDALYNAKNLLEKREIEYDPGEYDYAPGKDMYVKFFAQTFPVSMQVLVLWERPGTGHVHLGDDVLAATEDAVIHLIECGRYPNLKAIFLEEIEHNADQGPRTKTVYFRRAIEVGKDHGVDVHTLTNRNEMRHKTRFPEAPADKYSLISGPHKGVRPDVDWRFDPYIGRRVPLGCGKCGECEGCLAQYSKELWKSIEGL
ncbi:hypothetical protein P153DRAFT_431730 [Dothidotthia symphoricarpi CBS 119687]|uniref:F-box domain-containing protein n=1 Tax=Dothidotthia symphoricarpi CBS 119687 TaxID=1392245 RepID=A0A6A6ADD0_9PLEO|nr:uncharacterized protein P153DRAFT_431730 [Dothidotthia symphoricarpi CBS 119687]KAF2128877.1 hypothetical protein P153DRAFT_431730 [Dothidotthia symphoricarpi CBS 119687]